MAGPASGSRLLVVARLIGCLVSFLRACLISQEGFRIRLLRLDFLDQLVLAEGQSFHSRQILAERRQKAVLVFVKRDPIKNSATPSLVRLVPLNP